MATLVDTSILGRLANLADPHHAMTQAAVAKLHRQGEMLHITPQNLVEFRNFATRSTKDNGLGLSSVQTAGLTSTFEASFQMLQETPAIYPAWRHLVESLNIIGKQVHDARLVAVCHVYQMNQLLTFNVGHFSRLAALPPGIMVLDPASV